MAEETDGIDVAPLGPQIRYKLAEAKKICGPKNVPVDVIPMTDYGTMNGKNVLNFALKFMVNLDYLFRSSYMSV